MSQEKCDASRSIDLGSPAHKVGDNLFFYSGDVNEYRVPDGSCDAVVLDMMVCVCVCVGGGMCVCLCVLCVYVSD
jgi:hypothetical protein